MESAALVMSPRKTHLPLLRGTTEVSDDLWLMAVLGSDVRQSHAQNEAFLSHQMQRLLRISAVQLGHTLGAVRATCARST